MTPFSRSEKVFVLLFIFWLVFSVRLEFSLDSFSPNIKQFCTSSYCLYIICYQMSAVIFNFGLIKFFVFFCFVFVLWLFKHFICGLEEFNYDALYICQIIPLCSLRFMDISGPNIFIRFPKPWVVFLQISLCPLPGMQLVCLTLPSSVVLANHFYYFFPLYFVLFLLSLCSYSFLVQCFVFLLLLFCISRRLILVFLAYNLPFAFFGIWNILRIAL